MKKIYSIFSFLFLFFHMQAMCMEKSFNGFKACDDFDAFYKNYFQKIVPYEKLEEIVQRFSFIFWYLKKRNIGNLLNFKKNNSVDGTQNKQLEETEIEDIKTFFKKTVGLINKNDILAGYLNKGRGSGENFSEDPLKFSFDKVVEDLPSVKESQNKRHEEIEDLTFLVKNTEYTAQYVQQHVASDVHSSPEYFALEYEKIDFQGKKFEVELENLYEEVKETMKKKEASFFCGDLADRDTLLFLDDGREVKKGVGELNEEHKNIFLYNFFKDYYHTVHAAWQFYCLIHNQPDKITRWQVFGNHETANIHEMLDYKGQYGYFSELISSIRRTILPTEIYLFQQNQTIVFRHGFFTQRMYKESHVGVQVNDNFVFIYLVKKPEENNDLFSHFFSPKKKTPSLLSAVYWSDHYTGETVDLSVLINEENDKNIEEDLVFYVLNRGYSNKGSWKKGVEIGKKRSIENFKLLKLENFFVSDEIETIKKSHWALFCGHTHNENSLKFSAVKNDAENTVSFHPYYVSDDNFLFHFCMCSHHNLYAQMFEKTFETIQQAKKSSDMLIDWSATQPVHVLDTYYGEEWLKEKFEAYQGLKKFLKKFNENTVIKEFFRNMFKSNENKTAVRPDSPKTGLQVVLKKLEAETEVLKEEKNKLVSEKETLEEEKKH